MTTRETIDPSDHGASETRRLVGADGLERGSHSEPNPFPGLRPFGPAEAHLFFGRETHVEALLAKLSTRRFGAVVGSSGSGKSSFVLAGVLPRLRRGYRASVGQREGQPTLRSSWRIAHLRPGIDATGNLAIALHAAAQANDDEDDAPPEGVEAELEVALLGAQLRRNRNGLTEACSTLRLERDENLLVIVDQFEELFRFRAVAKRTDQIHDPAAAFVQLLLSATAQARVPVFVMLTLRSDFIGDCVQFTGLPEAINEGQYLLPSLNRDQRERAIRGPMAVARAAIAPALVQRLLNDAGGMSDQLPLLQHALMRSFELWRGDPEAPGELGVVHYELAGGLHGALAKHADEALKEVEAELGAAGVQIVERMFRALTDRGPQGNDVRRPCHVSEVLAVTGADISMLPRVLAHFSSEHRGFLIVQPNDRPLNEDALLDISHETLMRRWPRLAEWIAAERTFASQLQQMRDAEQKHAQGELGLWRDPELTLALAFLDLERPMPSAAARYHADLTRIRGFLRASVVERQAALDVARDAQSLRRMRRIFSEAKTSALLALLSVYLLLMLVGAGVLDRVVLGSTRFKVLSVSARHLVAAPGLHESLAAVVIDDQTVRALGDETRVGTRLGEPGSNWRTLQAEALQRLVDAGAKAIVLDFDFPELAQNDALGERGSNELAAAIRRARRAGTAVVIAGHPNTHPALRGALEAPAPAGSTWAAGIEASACLSAATDGTAVFANLLTMRPGQRSAPGLALAGLSGFWGTPAIFVDRPDHQLFLTGEGGTQQLTFAGVGRELKDAQDCYPSRDGDEPALQIIDLARQELTRQNNAPRDRAGASSIVPFERIIHDENLDAFRLKGALVLVGKQHKDDRIALFGTKRWGMSLHLNAMNDLLMGRAIHPISPVSQLIWMALLCACVAWQRLRNHDKAAWYRRAVLLGLVLANLAVVVGCAVVLEVLMDETYQVMAMLLTHMLVGRLDRRLSER